MNKAELRNRVADFIWGNKIEGTISAILPRAVINSSRYVVTTSKDVLDVQIPDIENHGIFYYSYTYHPPLELGALINIRVKHVRPWVDGQTIYFG